MENEMNTSQAKKQVYMASASNDGERPYAMLSILETKPKWTDAEFNDFVECFWEMSNYTSYHWETWSEILENYYPKARKFKQPKQSITVYRGATSPNGFSWTTDFNIARKFAVRNSDSFFSDNCDKSTIWQATVLPRGVLFTTNGRGESEVVVKFWEDDIWETEPFDYIELYTYAQKAGVA
jgi:hypothetical protein